MSVLRRRQVLTGGLAAVGAAVTAPLLADPAIAGPAAGPATAGSSGDASAAAVGRAVPVGPAELPWPRARAIVAETTVPSFPPATFDVRSYGARGDDSTDNTAAFAAAIDACTAAGGGTVVVPAGTYVTGAIRLRSNVNLRLDGATLMFSADPTKFPVVLTRFEAIECMNRSPMIYAYRERNIAVTGTGVLDAGRTAVWNKGSRRALLERMIANGLTRPEQRVVPGSGESLRSSFVQPYDCDTVLIQGVTLRNAIFWQVHPTLCRNVTVDAITTDAARVYGNTDGCDPESSDHVVIKNCDLGSNDDNIAIKSGRDEDGRRVNVPSQNIVIFGCVMNGTWGAITCGSEQTGGIRNVYAYRITIVGDTKYGLYVKSNTRRGGFTENVRVDRMTGVVERSVVFVTSTFDRQTGAFPPSFAGLVVTNSSCTAADRVLDVNGLPEAHIRGLTIRDCDFAGVRNPANIVGNVDDLAIANVRINGARLADTNIVEVVNRATGKVLAVSGDPAVNGAAVVQVTASGSPAQQWQLVSIPGGFVTLVNRAGGRVLDVTGASTADDAPVIQFRETEAANQQWRLADASSGYRTLTSRRSGKLLDVAGGSTADGAPVVQHAATGAIRQQWRLVTVG